MLQKLRDLSLTSWNFIGHDGVGTIGTPTTINSGDMAGILMIAVQALEKRTQELKAKDAFIVALEELAKEKQAQVEALERHTQETDVAINALKVETTKLKETDAQIETLVSRLEVLTRTVLAGGQLPNGERVNDRFTALPQ